MPVTELEEQEHTDIVIMWEFLFVSLLALNGALAFAPPSSCGFPNFSHKSRQTLSWLANRHGRHQAGSERAGGVRDWSKYGRSSVMAGNANDASNESQEFLNWVHGRENAESFSKFFLVEREKPKTKGEVSSAGGYHGQTSIAAVDLRAGNLLLDIPMYYCLSDEISRDDPSSLRGSPWELRLTTKILRERSKHKESPWYTFIRLLLSSIRLPLFFSESELYNCEDAYIRKEVQSMRNFAEASFHGLHHHETAGASFKDFVWALAIVYVHASACRKGDLKHEEDVYAHSLHLLIPFFGTMDDSSSATASVKLDGQNIKLVLKQEAAAGSFLQVDSKAKVSSNNFLYHGFVPTNLLHDRAIIFGDLQELSDWILSTNGEMDKSESLIMRRAESAIQLLHGNLRQLDTPLFKEQTSEVVSLEADYSMGVDGYIDPYMICVLLEVLYSDPRNSHDGYELNSVDDFGQQDLELLRKHFTLGNGTIATSELAGTLCLGKVEHAEGIAYKNALASTILMLQKRLFTLLDSFSTSVEEDEALLKASLWEGFSDDGESHLCETCQWQTEELSFNDNLAVQLRLRRKIVLFHALSRLSRNFSSGKDIHPNTQDKFLALNDSSNAQFLKWCEEQGALISEKLAVVNFHDKSNATSSSSLVRGVQALQDIEQGEPICILPLKMGLFDRKDSSNLLGADSWHLAAAHLLREKSLGVRSKWSSYISILPQTIPTPICLNSNEVKQVQWWPVMRELVQVRQAIKKSFSQLNGPNLAWANFEEYRWAVTMVHSRAFTLPVGDDEEYGSYVLMPFMDMINHHFEYQADWMSLPVREGKLEIVAKKHVFKGQQLFASFGPRSNDNLFLYYGFVLENNPFDSVQIFPSFEDGVRWFIGLWRSICDEKSVAILKERCKHAEQQQLWVRAKMAIEDYAAGITEQRPEWWDLVNTWADFGYEYMQFQPSPSIYTGGVVDPTLLIALEAVAGAPEFSSFSRHHVRPHCEHGHCDMELLVRSSVRDFFTCIDNTKWLSARSALHSQLCLESLSQALAAVNKQSYVMLMVKVSLGLRCLEILNSFPTSLNEDKLLLEESLADSQIENTSHIPKNSIHLSLTIRYRYNKKLFLKNYINQVRTYF